MILRCDCHAGGCRVRLGSVPVAMKLFLSLTAAIYLVLLIPHVDGAADSVVVFNEVQYNPPGGGEEGEWLELFNQMGIKVDLSGWRIDGIN